MRARVPQNINLTTPHGCLHRNPSCSSRNVKKMAERLISSRLI